MGIRICPKCNGKVSTSRNVCIHCGYVFPSSKKCPDCGEAVDIKVMECPVCGHLFNKASSVNEPSNDVKESVIEEKIKTNIPEPEIVVATVERSTETEENNLEVEKEIVVEEHNETSQVVEEDTAINDNEMVAPVNDVTPTLVLKETEDESTKPSLECPYCGSDSLLQIGIEYYFCNICKGKFLNSNNITSESFDQKVVEKKTDVSKISNNIESNCDVNIVSSNNTTTETFDQEVVEKKNDVSKISNNIESNSDVNIVTSNNTTIEYKHPETIENQKEFEDYCKSQKAKKKVMIILSILIVVVLTIILVIHVKNKANYDNALSLLETNVDEAINILDNCSYGDSFNQACFARARQMFNEWDFYTGIYYMHEGTGVVYATYKTNGGTDISSGILFNNSINVSPTKEGYTFTGWTLSSYVFSSSDNYTVNLTLSANWSANSYLIEVYSSLSSAGSVSIYGCSTNSSYFVFDSSVTIIATTNSGYTFAGWYVGETLISLKSNYTFFMPAKSVQYRAKWKKNSSTVSANSSDEYGETALCTEIIVLLQKELYT